jgi:outer membrane protein assembly factor BamD (BamD/ComL family)
LWNEAASAFDVILDPQQVNRLLNVMGKLHDESKKAPNQEDRLDALYEMGERALDLADLMTKDKQSHGVVDPSLAAVIQRRLKPYGIEIAPDSLGYHYDLAAFREYLRLAPAGKRATDARYVLIGFDEPGENVAALQKSIAAKEAFIRQYPNFSEMSLVKFLLAQQHVRLARVYATQKNPALSAQQRQMAENLYRQVVKQFPASPEAEAAADYLAQTGAKK